jgi:hypothetical protein
MVQRCRRFLRDLAPFSFAFHFLSSLFFESVKSKRGSHVIKYRPDGLHPVVVRPVLVAAGWRLDGAGGARRSTRAKRHWQQQSWLTCPPFLEFGISLSKSSTRHVTTMMGITYHIHEQ